jgi:acyl-CoA thioesterase YciA
MENRMKVTSKICMTKDVGTNGNLFGGNMLAWMDEAAAIFAQQITGKKVVSVRFAEIIFKKPVSQDDVIEFYCEKIKQGHTSVTFDIFAVVKNEEVFRTECTFVAVDNNGRKTPIEWPEENQDQ